ncbi:MAG: exodeoxyribonuclease VII large subunit [Clostridia bacterium]|nr:exodeoxyribonuclease VII large subunit [Clostridia bacterium]
MQKRIITVSELNEYLKMLFEYDEVLRNIYIKGEISNFTNHYKTGHFYFSLKDAGGSVRAVMFRGNASKLKFMPENGMRVIVGGRVSVFPRDGQYQIYVDVMEPDGIGALYLAYEQLRAKLEKEGLFAASRKRPLPKLPQRIGIVTSPTGAAIRDMLHIAGRRFPAAEIVLYPALVQGADAPASIMRGIRYFNVKKAADVLIIGRGGGSIEDLWAFNDENLVRTVAASEIPIVSAVGHETDFTLCDFAADLRAPTPSAAAELVVPDRAELAAYLKQLDERISLGMSRKLSRSRDRLAVLASSRTLTDPMAVIDDKRMALMMEERALHTRMERILEAKRAAFQYKTAKLEALNPLAVVARGYSTVFDRRGVLVKSTAQLETGDRISVSLADGKVYALVDKIESDHIQEGDQDGGKKEENV